MPQEKNAIPPEWIARLEAMKHFRSAAELARTHGAPPHKQQHAEMEIWHYPLGVADGTLYSIHVAVFGDDASQTYLHMEPIDATDSARPSRRRWWQFW